MAEAIPEKTPDNGTAGNKTVEVSHKTKESPQAHELTQITEKKVQELKKEIEAGHMSVELMKTYLEALSEVKSPEFKPIILGLIFSGLNKKGIKFQEINHGTLVFASGKTPGFGFLPDETKGQAMSMEDIKAGKRKISEAKYADETLTKQYQDTFNSFLKKGKFSLQDIATTYTYRTSDIKNASEKKLTTSQYAWFLMEKYEIPVNGEENSSDTLANLTFANQAQYDTVVEVIQKTVNHQGDKDFLLLFISDKYKKSGILQNDEVKKYASFDEKSITALQSSLAQLSGEERAVLNLGAFNNQDDIINKWKHTPKAALGEIDGGMIGIFAFLGLFASMKWGWKGFFGMLGIGALLGAGGDKIVGNYFKKGLDAMSGNAQASEVEDNKSEVSKKYSNLFSNDIGGLKKESLNETTQKLLENKAFLKSDGKNLNNFDPNVKPEERSNFFESIGIGLDEKNKPYFEEIFKKLLEKRKSEGINITSGESIESFLLKKSNTSSESVPTTKKTLQEQLKEVPIEGKDIILSVLKNNKLGVQKLETIEKLYQANKLEATFRAYGQIEFFNKYKDGIIKIIEMIIQTETDKSKTLKQILS